MELDYDHDWDDDDTVYSKDMQYQEYFEQNHYISIYPSENEIKKFANTIVKNDYHWDVGCQMKTLEFGPTYDSIKREYSFCKECRCPLRKHNVGWLKKMVSLS